MISGNVIISFEGLRLHAAYVPVGFLTLLYHPTIDDNGWLKPTMDDNGWLKASAAKLS